VILVQPLETLFTALFSSIAFPHFNKTWRQTF